jgi:hypothetical protein
MNVGDRHWSSPSEGTTSFSLFYNLHGAANPVTNPKKVPKNLVRGDRRITGVVATHPAAGRKRPKKTVWVGITDSEPSDGDGEEED